MQANVYDVVPRKKGITFFKIGGQWTFKHYFEDVETFKELAEYYDKDDYRFILKTPGERNKAQKFLAQRGFDVKLVESTRGYVVKLARYARYAALLKNSVAHIETPEWRIFLLKDFPSVEEALRHGAKLVEVEVNF